MLQAGMFSSASQWSITEETYLVGDKEICNVFMLVRSINSSLKKYNVSWLQLQVKLVLI